MGPPPLDDLNPGLTVFSWLIPVGNTLQGGQAAYLRGWLPVMRAQIGEPPFGSIESASASSMAVMHSIVRLREDQHMRNSGSIQKGGNP